MSNSDGVWSLCDCKQNFRSVYSVVVWSLRDQVYSAFVSSLGVLIPLGQCAAPIGCNRALEERLAMRLSLLISQT